MFGSVSGLETFGTVRIGIIIGLARSGLALTLGMFSGREMTGIGTGLTLFGSGLAILTVIGLEIFGSTVGGAVLLFSVLTSGLTGTGLGSL